MNGNLNEGLLTRAKAKGYQRGVHQEKDKVRNRHKYGKKTKTEQDKTLNKYVLLEGTSYPRQM